MKTKIYGDMTVLLVMTQCIDSKILSVLGYNLIGARHGTVPDFTGRIKAISVLLMYRLKIMSSHLA